VGTTFEPIGGLDEIFYEDDLDSIQINSVASTGPKWWTFKLLWWVELLNWLVDLDEILYGGDDVEDDIESILLNLIASTIEKRQTFKLLRW
jgi:hypothetical protein